MPQKKRFILELPYFLATQAGSIWLRLLYASCYAALIVSYIYPIVGVLVSLGYCLTVWQVIELKTEKNPKYAPYNRFLLQRLVLCSVFALGLFVACSKTGVFNIDLWLASVVMLALINISDIFFTLKGFVGVAYINGKKS